MLKNMLKKKPKYEDDFEGDELALKAEEAARRKREEREVFNAKTPAVNIIPANVLNHYGILKIRDKFLIGILILALLFAGFFVLNLVSKSDTQSKINELNETTSSTQQAAQQLVGFQKFYDGVASARETMTEYTMFHIDSGAIMTKIMDAAAQSGVVLDNVNISVTSNAQGQDTSGTAACSSPDPFNSYSAAGCITFTGNAPNGGSVTQLVNALNATAGLQNAYVPSYTTSDDNVGVDGSVAFSSEFFTDRYSDLTLDMSSIGSGDDQLVDDGGATENVTNENTEEGEVNNG